MLLVAFSRRMCCSRVCRARTKPRRPSTSSVSPAIRPGMRRISASVPQKKPTEGPPKSSRLPSGWPSPRAMSAPHSPGGLRMPRVIGSTATTSSAPCSLAAAPSASTSSTAPRKLGLCRKTAAVSPSTAAASAAGVGEAVLEPDLLDLGVVADRVGGEGLAAVRVDAARDDEAAAAGRAHRQVAGGGDRGRALVEAGVGDRQPGQLRHRRLELEHHLQAALRDLRLVGRVRGQELGALGDRVDDRRHVVVVHPGADEADLVFGVGVAGRQRRRGARRPRPR